MNTFGKDNKEKLQSCEPCALEKAKRKLFATVGEKLERPLDAVSTDTTGSIAPPDMEGKILQLAVDVASGHTKSSRMKKKQEASDAIFKRIRRLKVAVGKKVKRYHSDKAKEQRTKRLIRELEAKGTQVTSTAQNTSKQNGHVERRFASLFAATRAALSYSGLPKKF